MRVFGSLADLLVPPGQQQRTRITDPRFSQAKIAGRIEETGIPALPIRQQSLDLIAKTHGSTLAEPAPRDNDVDPTSGVAALSGFFEHFDQRYTGCERHSAQDNHLYLRQELHRRAGQLDRHDIQLLVHL